MTESKIETLKVTLKTLVELAQEKNTSPTEMYRLLQEANRNHPEVKIVFVR